MRALQQQPNSNVAVILNANARRVTSRVRSVLEQRCDGIDVYYSRSLDEGSFLARQVLDLGYSTVLTGGGDGTIIQTINTFYQQTRRLPGRTPFQSETRGLQMVPAPVPALPAIGILKLGTGNALASVVGASRYDRDVTRIRHLNEHGLEPRRMELPLMETEGQVFPFAGLGWDAAILNDYNRLKDSCTGAISTAVFKSMLGYLVAAFGSTIPQVLRQQAPEVEVRALSDASLMAPDGSVAKEMPRGALLYRGPVSMLAFSTIPYYGYEFKMFPFTEGLTDRFQLRVATTGVGEVVRHMPGIWRGTYRSPNILDFQCSRVVMSFSRPVPYQVGGEARGERETLTVGMSSHPVELVDYRTTLAPPVEAISLADRFLRIARA